MENGTRQYWQSIEEVENTAQPASQHEGKDIPVDELLADGLSSNRRNFLKFFGFSLTAASLAACQKAGFRYALPYTQKPVDLIPGVPNWYASTFFDGQSYSSVLVKTREGRPIKIEGNPDSHVSLGGVGVQGHASVLGLYDDQRLQAPRKGKSGIAWDAADGEIKAALSKLAGSGKKIALLTSTIISPSTRSLIKKLGEEYKTLQWVQYDAVSAYGIIEANRRSFGAAQLPSYHFDAADMIVSFGADFLGTWLSSEEFAKMWVQNRKPNGATKMSRHVQFESQLSLTGANADKRFALKPSQQGPALIKLYNLLAAKAGVAALPVEGVDPVANAVAAAADELWSHKERGHATLVVCGSNDPNVQQVVNGINQLLGNYGRSIRNKACNLRQGKDADVVKLVEEMQAGQVGAILLYNVNPSYTLSALKFDAALKNVELKVSFSDREDETAKACDYILPDSHYLESWGDAEPYAGFYSLQQPTINPLFSTRQFQDSVLKLIGSKQAYYDYLRDFWKDNLLKGGDFETKWRKVVEKGVFEPEIAPLEDKKEEKKDEKKEAPKPAAAAVAAAPKAEIKGEKPSGDLADAARAIADHYGAFKGTEVVLYEKIGIGDGRAANNPWLQEFPDPISKISWDNYLAVNKSDADAKSWKTGDMASIKVGSVELKLPILVQPGLAKGTVAIALGYGRSDAGKAANGIGKSAYPLITVAGGAMHYTTSGAEVKTIGEKYDLATIQSHNTLMGRDIVRETTFDEILKNPKAGNKPSPSLVSLWDKYDYNGRHHWAMAIDMNACTGCGACVVSCQAENNIPVVGKLEILRGREMHWIRVDRYYSSLAPTELRGDAAETPAEQPEVVFMPVMCQQCDNAPCETVCPVLATTHSDEGLNQMTYNRCVGTRYCANNCPYKVRRFNWYDYTNAENYPYNPTAETGMARLVLNPDVTVRARGVMEKCTFCVQRLQAGKLEAKKAGRALVDGEVQTACSQSCPTGAIIFGDLNDPESAIAKAFKADRHYLLLEEVKTLPKVSYSVKVRNNPAKDTKAKA